MSFKSSFERTRTNGRAVTVVMTMRKVSKCSIRWPEYGGLR